MMGGSESIDFLAPSGSGENTLVTCERGDYAADSRDRPRRAARAVVPGVARRAGGGRDAGHRDMRGPRAFPRDRSGRHLEGDAGRRRRHRSCSRSSGATTGSTRQSSPRSSARPSRPAHADEIREAFGAEPGSLGPVGFGGRIVLDETMRDGQFVAGANRTGFHLRGVAARSRLRGRGGGHPPRARGRRLPALRRRAALPDRDRGRSHLQARNVLLGAARRVLPRRAVGRAADRDGELRHRPGSRPRGDRRAASRRAWDRSGRRVLAPYDVHVLSLSGGSDEIGGARGDGRGRPRAQPGTTSCSTIVTPARERSSPTPTCSAARSGSRSVARSLEDGAVDLRRRTGRRGRTRAPRVCD